VSGSSIVEADAAADRPGATLVETLEQARADQDQRFTGCDAEEAYRR